MFRSKLICKFLSVSKEINKINRKTISTNPIRNVPAVTLARNVFEDTTANSEAPPLIIMHGLLGSKQNWRSICKALQLKMNPKRKIIAVDARNHGESPHDAEHSYKVLSDDIAKVLKDLNIKRAVVMGHSMGGKAMMYFVLKYPELVEKAIIVDTSPINSSRDLIEIEVIFGAMKAVNIPNHLSISEGRKQAEKQLMETIQNKATVDFILLNLRKNEEKGFHWVVNVDALHDYFKYTSKFPLDELNSAQYSGAVLFIGGTLSTFMKKDELQDIQKIFPKANILWLETGHLVHFEKPAELISLVINFLNSRNG